MKKFEKRRKCLSLIIALLMVFSCVPGITFAEEVETELVDIKIIASEEINDEDISTPEKTDVQPETEISIVDSGVCGEKSTWSLDNTGKLIISGEGEVIQLYDFDLAYENIRYIILEEGITWIDRDVLSKCTNVKEITIPESVEGYFAEPTFVSSFPEECIYKLYKNSFPDLIIKSKNKIYLTKPVTEIRTPQDFIDISKDLFGNYKLMNDIDMLNISFCEIGMFTGGEGFGPFYGTLDGNGNTIKNITINELNNNSQIGMFEYNGGIIKNLTVENVTINLKDNNYNEYSVGSISASNSGEIINCYCSNVNIIPPKGAVSSLSLGGIVAGNIGTVRQCGNMGKLVFQSKSENGGSVGGVVGSNQGIVQECYNNSDLESEDCTFGGIVGNNLGIIENCFNNGDLIRIKDNGTKSTGGGIAGGSSNGSSIKNCIAVGNYIASYYEENNCQWSSDFYGITYAHFEGELKNSFYLDRNQKYVFCKTQEEKKTLQQMIELDTYKDFDFKTIWNYNEHEIPTLRNVENIRPCYNHIYSFNEIIEASCDVIGKEIKLCANCGSVLLTEIAAKGHKEIVDGAVEQTCMGTGLTRGTHCNVCKKVIIAQEETPALGHDFNNYISNDDSTCIKNGTATSKCSRCDATDTIEEQDSAKGHMVAIDEAITATCTETGLTEGSHCSVCNEVLVAQKVVPVIDHSYSEYKVTSKATFGKTGVQTATCTLCNKAKVTKSIPAIKTPVFSTSSYTFNKKTKTPSVIVKDTTGKKIAVSTSYAKGRKNVGEYAVKVTVKANSYYTGTKTVYFKINPAGKSISKLSASKKAFTVKWSKPSSTYRKQMTGYQIRYSTSSKMAGAKIVTVKSNTATSKKISKLKAKKKYYVQVRTYKTVKGVKYYSSWSKVKSVKTK